MKTLDFLRDLTQSGIGVELKKNRIALTGPKEKLTPSLLKQVKELREEIAFLLRSQRRFQEFEPVIAVEKKDYYPVSPTQHRLFVLQALQPQSVLYNMQNIIPLTGAVHLEEVERISRLLCQRHESLRTFFPTVAQRPVQRVAEAVVLRIEYLENNSMLEGYNNLSGNFVRPFDLSRPPLWRIRLIKKDTNSFLLMLDIHHIIADGVSIAILIREIMSLWRGRALPTLRLQYRDFSEWQYEMSRTGQMEQQRKFWQDVFREQPPVLNLPTDFSRPAVHEGAGKSVAFTVGNDSLGPLRQIVKHENATVFISLLAIFTTLLAKLSGQEDIVVGVPVAGRNHADLEGIVGVMINTLPIRNVPCGSLTFRQYIEIVRDTAVKAFENQDLSFADILSGLRLPRDLGRHPLFDVMLNYTVSIMKFPEPRHDERGSNHREATVKFDLNVSAMEIQGGIYFEVEYCSELFKPRTIDRFVDYFKRLLRAVSLFPDQELSKLEMISDEERELVLQRFNRHSAEYSCEDTISSLFWRQVNRSPCSVALMSMPRGGLHISYKQLHLDVLRLALRLQKRGIGRGSVVVLAVERSFEMVMGILGILECGACYVPIDPGIPGRRRSFMLEDSGACLAVAGSTCEWDGIDRLPVREEENDKIEAASNYQPVCGDPLDPAYVIYTSGSTGHPKGVVIEHKSLVNRLLWMGGHYSLGNGDVMLQKTPYSFDVSVWELIGWAVWGSRLVVLPHGGEKDIAMIVDAISFGAVTHIHFIPSMLRIFIDFVNLKGILERLGSLKRVFCSGETLTKVHAAAFHQLFEGEIPTGLSNLYGPTEAAIDVSYYDCPTRGTMEYIPIGRAIPNVRLYILSQYGNVQPPGVVGELHISGIAVGRGYLNKPERTDECFVADPFVKGERMYRTGDLARWSLDGHIEFLGRKDQQVKIRGYRIELQEIESCMVEIPWISDAVVTVNNSTGATLLCAYLTSHRHVGPFELRAALSEVLPGYMIPSCFTQLEEMPLNLNGKVDRGALPEPDIEYSLGTYVPPRNEMEAEVAGFWREVLELFNHNVGIDDNFFQLGGDSIKANALSIKIYMRFGVEIPLGEFFAFPTIRQQMEIINERSSRNNRD